MPIDKEWSSLYPQDWSEISSRVRDEAGQACEWCGAVNGSRVTGAKGKEITVVLTVAHLNQDPRDCARANLAALCQSCHITHDKQPSQATRRRVLRAELLNGQTSMF